MGIRIDELPASVDPSLEHVIAAMKAGQTVKLTIDQVREVIYATLEDELGDATRLTSGVVAVANGGTGQNTAAKAFDALVVSGGDAAVTGGVLNLNALNGSYVDITSSAALSSITLAAGKHRIATVLTTFRITASSTLIVNGLSSGSYQLRVNDRLFIQGYSGGVVRVWLGRPLNQAGEIGIFAHGTVPVGWVKANGALLSRTTYADLFAAVGTYYSAGDGSTTFGIPDYRGEFLRGWDDSRGVDAGRSLGSSQSDDLKSHTHTTTVNGTGNLADAGAGPATMYSAFNTVTGATGGAETRPRNVAAMFCIRY